MMKPTFITHVPSEFLRTQMLDGLEKNGGAGEVVGVGGGSSLPKMGYEASPSGLSSFWSSGDLDL